MCIEETTWSRRQAIGLGLAALMVPKRSQRASVPPVEVTAGLQIHPRRAWGDGLAPLPGLVPEDDVRFLLVHHTAGRSQYDVAAVPDQMREVFFFHTGPEKGWPDVCYNFFIDRFGGVWEGRAGSLDGPVMADATGGSQGFAQLICLLGNYHEVEPSPEMIESLSRVLAWLEVRHRLDPTPGATTTFVSRGSNRWPEGTSVTARVISGHRDMSQTVCPGDFVYPLLDEAIPRRVSDLVGQLPGATTTVAPTTTTTVAPTTTTTVAPTTTTTVAPTTFAMTMPAPDTTGEPRTTISLSGVVPTGSAPGDAGDDSTGVGPGVIAAAVAAGAAAASVLAFKASRRDE